MAAILVAYSNASLKKQIEYTFDILFCTYNVVFRVFPYAQIREDSSQNHPILISYGKQKPAFGSRFCFWIHIYESEFFGKSYLKKNSLPKIPLEKFNDLPIIYVGSEDLEDKVIWRDKRVETNIDIVASAFFMLTRYEEVISDERDKFGRFPEVASLAFKEDFLDFPIVNGYIELLWKWIDDFNLAFEKKKLWRDKDFAVCLTHDVDKVKKYSFYPPLGIIKNLIIKKKKPLRVLSTLIDQIKTLSGMKKDPYDTFDYLINLEKSYDFTSSYNFMAGGDTRHDKSYSIKSSQILHLLKRLESQTLEIGLHASFSIYDDYKALKLEKQRLARIAEIPIYGGRQHYLRCKIPETWKIWEKAGLKYNSSLGFPGHEGFRAGICLPYKPFDVFENRQVDIWDLPLTVMDASLYGYQNLTPEEGFQRIKQIIGTVRSYGGLFVLLWHNSSLDNLQFPGWAKIYEEVIKYISRQNAFVGSAIEIVEQWEKALVLNFK